MLASSSRSALKRAQHKICNVVAEASAVTCIREQRRHISAAHVAVDTYTSPIFNERGDPRLLRNGDSNYRVETHTPLARHNMDLATALDRKRPIKVMELAQRMKQEGVQPDITTYKHLLDACAQQKLNAEARAIFEDMLAMGIQPDRQIFHNLLKSSAPVEQFELHRVLRLMEEWRIQPNEITYEIIITRLARAQRLELALQYLAQLGRAGLSPTLKTASAIITTAAELGFPRLALDLALAFEETSVRRLDTEVWVDVLISSAEALYADGTVSVWQKVVDEMHILPDEGCCIQVLHTAARHGLSDLALSVIEVLKKIEVVWSEHHVAPVIEALCQRNELKEAIIMLDFMRKNDIVPTLETASPILQTISKDTDAVDNAWGTLEILHEEGHTIDAVALNVVIQAAISLHDLQRAIGTYKASSKLDVKLDADTFNLLLLGCIEARHRQLGDRLLSEMKEAGIKPDTTTYERMVRLCLTQSMYEDAFFYLEEMKSLNMVPPLIVYDALVRKLFSVGDVRYKLALEELKECGYDVPKRLKSFIDSGGAHDGSSKASRPKAESVVL